MWWRTMTAQALTRTSQFGGGLVYAPKPPAPSTARSQTPQGQPAPGPENGAALGPSAAPPESSSSKESKSEDFKSEDFKSESPNVNGPHDESPVSKGNNDPYAVGTTRAQQEMDRLNKDPEQPAWYNMPLGAQIERLHMNQSVHPQSPMEMGDTDPQSIRNFQEYNSGKGEQAFKDNPATLHTI